MVSDGALVEGREIRLGALVFIADDSAWLQEAPLDVDALPRTRRPPAATVDPVPVDSNGFPPPCDPPEQAHWSVEASAVGEACGGPPMGHPSSHGDQARRNSLWPVRLAPLRPHPSATAVTPRRKS